MPIPDGLEKTVKNTLAKAMSEVADSIETEIHDDVGPGFLDELLIVITPKAHVTRLQIRGALEHVRTALTPLFPREIGDFCICVTNGEGEVVDAEVFHHLPLA